MTSLPWSIEFHARPEQRGPPGTRTDSVALQELNCPSLEDRLVTTGII